MNLIEELQQLEKIAIENINASGNDIEKLRISFLGKKGQLTTLLKGMKDVSPEQKPKVGEVGNHVRQVITQLLAEKKHSKRLLH